MNEDVLNDELSQMYGPNGTRVLNSETLKAPISELKLKPPTVVGPATPVGDAIHQMTENHIGCLMVVVDDKLVGIFTERDVLTKVAAKGRLGEQIAIRDVMTADPSTLTADHMIAYALNFMWVGGFRHVPIVDEADRPLGLVGVRDVLRYLAGYFPEEVKNLPPHTQSEELPRNGG